MIEVYELLRTKENELARVRSEIEALRTVTALLAEPDDIPNTQPGPDPNISSLPVEAFLPEENILEGSSSADFDEVLSHSKPSKRSRLRDLGRSRRKRIAPDSQETSVA
jgi:hypothetical protein